MPIRIASAAWQNDRPKKPVASTPRKTVANSRFGDSQVQSSCSGLPCRSERADELGAAGLDGDDLGAVLAGADVGDHGLGLSDVQCVGHAIDLRLA